MNLLVSVISVNPLAHFLHGHLAISTVDKRSGNISRAARCVCVCVTSQHTQISAREIASHTPHSSIVAVLSVPLRRKC